MSSVYRIDTTIGDDAKCKYRTENRFKTHSRRFACNCARVSLYLIIRFRAGYKVTFSWCIQMLKLEVSIIDQSCFNDTYDCPNASEIIPNDKIKMIVYQTTTNRNESQTMYLFGMYSGVCIMGQVQIPERYVEALLCRAYFIDDYTKTPSGTRAKIKFG